MTLRRPIHWIWGRRFQNDFKAFYGLDHLHRAGQIRRTSAEHKNAYVARALANTRRTEALVILSEKT